jgi:hypothetical protein
MILIRKYKILPFPSEESLVAGNACHSPYVSGSVWRSLHSLKATLPLSQEDSSNSNLSYVNGPSRISVMMTVPGRKSCSKIGSPAPLIFARTNWRKCHLRSWSGTQCGFVGSRQTGSRVPPSTSIVSIPNSMIL